MPEQSLTSPRHIVGSRIALTAFVAVGMFGCASTHNEEEGKALAAELAQILVSHQAYDTAVPILQRGIAENPRDAHMHRLLGIVLRDRGLYDEAQRELQTAGELEPNNPDTYAAMGVLYDLRNQSDIAENWHKQAIALNPGRSDFYNNLGFSYYLQHRDAEAVGSYTEALRRNPNMRRAYNNLGFAQARLGQYDVALRSFEQGGGKASALANLGFAYELAGDKNAARELYKEALKHDRKLTVARKNLKNLELSENAAQEKP